MAINLKSLNRPIVFDKRVWQDSKLAISLGILWSVNHIFHASVRGNNRRIKETPFQSLNGRDSVHRIY